MRRPKPFLYVVVQTHHTASGYDVVPAGSEHCERCRVVYGPAPEAACLHQLTQLTQLASVAHRSGERALRQAG